MKFKIPFKNFQSEIINSTESHILMNWAEGLGKTLTLASYILENKPKTILWVNFDREKRLGTINEKINEILRRDSTIKDNIASCVLSINSIQIEYNDGTETNIKLYSENDLYCYHNKTPFFSSDHYNLIVYEDLQPFNTGHASHRTICAITENNYDKHLQDKYNNYFISEHDYRTGITNRMMLGEFIEMLKDEDNERFLRKFAILDNLYGKDSFIFETFKTKTLRELAYEYEKLPKTKDTVMTRNNIINMICNLK